MITLFFLCYNGESIHKIVDRERLKLLVRNLELLVDGLKAEVYSDPEIYRPEDSFNPGAPVDYDEIFNDDGQLD